jgi:hypothetical protein
MSKVDINKILLANDYLVSCKLDSKKAIIAQRYLTTKIEKVLAEKEDSKLFFPVKTFFSFILSSIVR